MEENVIILGNRVFEMVEALEIYDESQSISDLAMAADALANASNAMLKGLLQIIENLDSAKVAIETAKNHHNMKEIAKVIENYFAT